MPARSSSAVWGFAVSLSFVFAFVLWAETSPDDLKQWSQEDGPIETATAAIYFIAGLLFLYLFRSGPLLSDRSERRRRFWILALSAGCFVVCAEEISWGQRLLGFDAPDAIRRINRQKEFNLHNFEGVHDNMYRLQSVAMFAIGLVLPLLALTRRGAQLLTLVAIPVAPFRYSPLFVGAYLYNRAYFSQLGNSSMEVRELLMALGMACFAAHGALRPQDLSGRRTPPSWLATRRRRNAAFGAAPPGAGACASSRAEK